MKVIYIKNISKICNIGRIFHMIYSPKKSSPSRQTLKCQMASVLKMVSIGKQNLSNEKKKKMWKLEQPFKSYDWAPIKNKSTNCITFPSLKSVNKYIFLYHMLLQNNNRYFTIKLSHSCFKLIYSKYIKSKTKVISLLLSCRF